MGFNEMKFVYLKLMDDYKKEVRETIYENKHLPKDELEDLLKNKYKNFDIILYDNYLEIKGDK